MRKYDADRRLQPAARLALDDPRCGISRRQHGGQAEMRRDIARLAVRADTYRRSSLRYVINANSAGSPPG
jgi:hypothetical protein